MFKYVSSKVAQRHLNVSEQTLRNWADQGSISFKLTKGGHRRYKIFIDDPTENRENIIYARVSSSKQKEDLKRQIRLLRKNYPEDTLIYDVGSGINFKRKGLISILDKVLQGSVRRVVIAHKDRLTRFGFELFDWIFDKFGTKLVVLKESSETANEELAEDLMSIITVFTARYYGTRRYTLQKNKNIS